MMCCIIVTSLFHVTDQSPSTMKVVLGVTTVVLLAGRKIGLLNEYEFVCSYYCASSTVSFSGRRRY